MSTFWKAVLEALVTRLSPSSPYHPPTDGKTEIMNLKMEK